MAERRTTDHDEIKRWAKSRGGRPATVKGTARESRRERGGPPVGLLRIGLPHRMTGHAGVGVPDFVGDEALETIDWPAFFDRFEEEKLALVYDDESAEPSYQLVSRHA